MKTPTLVLSALMAAAVFAEPQPLPEHPRPDWERADWINLNGTWDFGFAADRLDRKIVVPFGWGSKLSGVADEGDTGFYRRSVTVPAAWKGKRVFVVVGASDHDTTCTFAGAKLGTRTGGYVPHEFELTEYVTWGKPQELAFRVWDPPAKEAQEKHYLYGKQGYGNVRGIWQTVYLEARGETYLDAVRLTPSIAAKAVTADVALSAPAKKPLTATLTLDGRSTTLAFAPGEMRKTVAVPIPSPHLWTLDDPYLYDVTLALAPSQASNLQSPIDNSQVDAVRTYFGFREVGVGKTPNGHSYVTLNGKPLYLQLCLDQSYHPDGSYTFPTDEFMKNEILISKKLALAGNRVHIKVEVPRKLYWADKLGLLIQADVPCAWGNADEAMFEEHWKCFEGMVRRDFNHPSIYQWTLFNETWGLLSNRSLEMGLAAGGRRDRAYRAETQRRVAAAYFRAKALDPTRLVEDNSPCRRDHVVTDVNTFHCYCAGYDCERIYRRVCDETYPGSPHNYIGGHVQGDQPMMNSECGNVWGYKGSTGDCDWSWDYHLMINAFRRNLKCAGFLYTEHHDVINEWNGYVRYDRTWKETGFEDLFPGMTLADLHADAYLPLDVEMCRTYAPGAVCTVPVDISLVTDRHAGRKAALRQSLRYVDGEGRLVTTPAREIALADPVLKSWQTGRIADIKVELPTTPACGTVCVALTADGETIARNFQCFVVPGDAADVTPSAGAWSLKRWTAMDGAKQCGAGDGYFEYELAVPDVGESFVFRAEVSTKRYNGKDRPADAPKKGGVDYMLGGGSFDRSRNPNSYPQTSVAEKYAGEVVVSVGGATLATVKLADDPADHRGILSWAAQKRKAVLDEAGSYGYLVEVPVPTHLVRAAKGGTLAVRLSAKGTGLAVYGAKAGRYPFAPHLAVR